MGEPIRTFIAVNLAETLRERMAQVQQELRATRADVKWVSADGFHMTLKFLGNVDAEAMDDVVRATGDSLQGVPPAPITFRGVGAYPRVSAPRVVWAGVTEGGEQLVAMAEQVEQATEKLGFERERRPFSPHLTLGRVRTPRQPELSEAIQRLREVEIGSMTVDAVYVMRSQLTPKGAIYSVISEIKLSG